MSQATGNPPVPPGLDRFIGPGVLLISFLAYLLTLAPTVTFWDSGELILSAVSLGNSHPPAYPVFCTLGKGFSLMPLGSAAYRVNLLAASAASASAYLLYRLITQMGAGRPDVRWIACALALSFAFLRSLWSVSVLSEMYSLNAAFLVAILIMLLKRERGGGVSFLHASAFLLGLALVNHQSVLMFLPAYAVYYISSAIGARGFKTSLQSLFFFLLGYSVVVYLPVRAHGSPAINIGDPRTLSDFLWEVKWPEDVAMIKSMTGGMLRGMTGAGTAYLAAGAAGFAALAYMLRRRRYALLLVLSAALYYVGTGMVTGPETGMRKWGLYSKFYTPVYLFIGLSAVSLLFYVWERRPAGRGLPAAAAMLCLALPAGLAVHNYKAVDNSRNFFACDFASNTLKSVGQDAAVFAWGDNGIFPVWYLQGVERYRDDVFFIHTEILTYP